MREVESSNLGVLLQIRHRLDRHQQLQKIKVYVFLLQKHLVNLPPLFLLEFVTFFFYLKAINNFFSYRNSILGGHFSS